MPTRLGNAGSALFTRLANGAGISATYEVESETVAITAIQARWQDNGGVLEDLQTIQTDTDWIVRKSDLVIHGNAIVPRTGDWIRTATRKYKVLPPAQDQRCFQPMGNDDTLIRISTKDWGPNG